ncbi:MAG: hypothetical protein WBB02_09645 [Saprospiraceae bacterium]
MTAIRLAVQRLCQNVSGHINMVKDFKIIGGYILNILSFGLIMSCNFKSNTIDSFTNSRYSEDSLLFDTKEWNLNLGKHYQGENTRHYMLSDLINKHIKLGMDSTDLKIILGEPERDFGFSYNLGLYKSGFDSTFLIFEFNSQGKLKEIKIETI